MPIVPKYMEEPSNAYAAFVDYCDLGNGRRSVNALLQYYDLLPNHKVPNNVRVEGQIQKWMKEFRWEDRAGAYDRDVEERQQVFTFGEMREVKRQNVRRLLLVAKGMDVFIDSFERKIKTINELEGDKYVTAATKLLKAHADLIRLLNEEMGQESESDKIMWVLDYLMKRVPVHQQDQMRNMIFKLTGVEQPKALAIQGVADDNNTDGYESIKTLNASTNGDDVNAIDLIPAIPKSKAEELAKSTYGQPNSAQDLDTGYTIETVSEENLIEELNDET